MAEIGYDKVPSCSVQRNLQGVFRNVFCFRMEEEKMTETKFAPINSLQVLAYIIRRCEEMGIFINITKLQKLMYCCYGTILGKFGVRLIDEPPSAWQYGPVFPEALRSIQFFQIAGFRQKPTPDVDDLPESFRRVIDETLANFGKFTAKQLSEWTHIKGSPWYKASDGGASLYHTLSDEDIKNYFRANVLL